MALAVVAATAAVLVLWGIGLLSALIELVVFVAGLIAWVLAGSAADGSSATAEGIVAGRGGVRVRQRARTTLARLIFARGDVTVEQEDGRER